MYQDLITNLVSSVKEAYDFDIFDINIIQDGSDNTVLKASISNTNKIIIRISKRKKTEQSYQQEGFILDVFHNAGVPVPRCIKNKLGKYFSILNDKKYVCSEFLEGDHLNLKQKPDLSLVASAAYALASMHRIRFENEKLVFDRTIYTEVNRLQDKEYAFRNAYENADTFINLVSNYTSKIMNFSVNEPTGFLHNDYRTHNVLVKNNYVVAILDFDWSTSGPFKKDVAHSILEWSYPDGAQAPWNDVIAVFYKAYYELMPDVSKNHLKDWITYTALSDACTYYIDRLPSEDVKDKKKMQSYMHLKALYFHEMSNNDFESLFCL